MTFHAEIWSGLVSQPGLYLGTPEERYHEDPCPEPSLSATVAKIALTKAPSKAQAAHPRLRAPDYPEDLDEEDEEPAQRPWYMDVGSAVHSLVLQSGMEVAPVNAKDWRTNAAKTLRKELRNERKIPLLVKHYNVAQRMAARLRPRLIDLLGSDFAAEAMACSRSEYGWWMRSLMDACSTDLRHIVDIKTTQLDVSPFQVGKTMNRNGNEFQNAFYFRNLDRLDPEGMGRRKFTFIYQEMDYPHEIMLAYADPALLTVGDDDVQAAMRKWDRAMKSGEWEGYPREPVPVAPENWKMRALQDRVLMDEDYHDGAAA